MRKWNRLQSAQPRVLSQGDAPGAAVALLVEREHQSAFECGFIEGASGVAEVVFEAQNAEVRRFAQRLQQTPIVQLASQFAERFGLIVAAGNRRKRRSLGAHPR